MTAGPGIEEVFVGASQTQITLYGNELNNRLIVTTYAGATIYGLGGNDTLIGTPVDDRLYGGSGNDLLDGGSGADRLQGDSGFDTADYSSRTASVRVTLDNVANDGESFGDAVRASSTIAPADNVRADVEAVLGGSAGDYLEGNPFANKLVGNGGNDTIWGGAGNDTITGGAGRDMLFGQGGDDTFYARDGRTDTLDGGSGTDRAQRDKTSTITDQVTSIESFIA